MLEVQKYLQANSLEKLKEVFCINYAAHPHEEPLIILNYNQIDSPKKHPIVKECRGLCLEKETWKVVGRSFPRFFNLGEYPEVEKDFNWNNCFIQEKIDGSLMLAFKYNGIVHCNTRGSFGHGEINDSNKTWQECFWNIIDEVGLEDFFENNPNKTLVFEFVSPYNKVVILHELPQLFLLTIIDNLDGKEISVKEADEVAENIRVLRPKQYLFSSANEVANFVGGFAGNKFEGVVVNDGQNRIKVKNPDYLKWHHLWNNGNVASPKSLVPLILKGETDEICAGFPFLKQVVLDLQKKLDGELAHLEEMWEKASALDNQKDFAMMVKDSRFAAVLFTARTNKMRPKDVWRDSAQLILKKLFK